MAFNSVARLKQFWILLWVAVVGIAAHSAGLSADGKVAIRPESGKWQMMTVGNWIGGGQSQIKQVRDLSEGPLRKILTALEKIAAGSDAALSNLDAKGSENHHPPIIFMGYKPTSIMPLSALGQMMPGLGPALQNKFLVGNGECQHVSTEQRSAAGLPSVRGTFRCKTEAQRTVVMVFEQIRLPAGGEISAVLQADDRVRLLRVPELDQMLDSIRLQ
jgi:hypothetical protein